MAMRVAPESAGDMPKAREAYRAFLKAWPDADEDLQQVTRAKAWLRSH
jgi:hypothetical protein